MSRVATPCPHRDFSTPAATSAAWLPHPSSPISRGNTGGPHPASRPSSTRIAQRPAVALRLPDAHIRRRSDRFPHGGGGTTTRTAWLLSGGGRCLPRSECQAPTVRSRLARGQRNSVTDGGRCGGSHSHRSRAHAH